MRIQKKKISKAGKTKGLSLKIKVIGMVLALSLIPLTVVGVMAYNNAATALNNNIYAAEQNAENEVYEKLVAIGDTRHDEIEDFFHERIENVKTLAESPATKDAILEIDAANMAAKSRLGTSGSALLVDEEYKAAFDKWDGYFTYYIQEYGYYDLFLICPEDGDVFYTVAQEADFGTELSNENTHLATTWQRALTTGEAVISDTKSYAPSNGAAALFTACPVTQNGETIGVVALQIGQHHIDEIMQLASGMGDSGETYLLGSDYYFRSNSRLSSEDTLLNVKVETTGATTALSEGHYNNHDPYGDYTSKTEAEAQGRHYSSDLGGVPVIGYTEKLEIEGMEQPWIVMAEIDVAEAHAAIDAMMADAEAAESNLLMTTVGVIIAAAIIVTIVGLLVTRSIVNPIQSIAKDVTKMADTGDLSIRPSVKSKDEIGQMANSLNAMLDNVAKPVKELSGVAEKIAQGDLRHDVNIQAKGDVNSLIGSFSEMTTKLKDLIGDIRRGAQETASAAEELSSSAEEVNASVEQTSSTIQQIADGSSRTSEQTNMVIDETKRAGDAANKGQQSASQVSSKMNDIQTTTEDGANKISSLGEKSKEIGNIVDTINQISEQTNLLALNAAIEAARAGEAGRGFAVVADEVRKLAEESGQATQQISDLIKSIQGEIEGAVTSMNDNTTQVEEGSKGVAEAVSIFEELPNIVESVNKAASEVASVAQENAAGSEEASSAMQQVSASMQQVSGSAQKLSELAEDMNALVGQFTIDDDNIQQGETNKANYSNSTQNYTGNKQYSAQHNQPTHQTQSHHQSHQTQIQHQQPTEPQTSTTGNKTYSAVKRSTPKNEPKQANKKQSGTIGTDNQPEQNSNKDSDFSQEKEEKSSDMHSESKSPSVNKDIKQQSSENQHNQKDQDFSKEEQKQPSSSEKKEVN